MRSTLNQVPTWRPNRKITAGTVASALVSVIALVASKHGFDEYITPETLVLLNTVVFALVSYWVPPGPNEGISEPHQ